MLKAFGILTVLLLACGLIFAPFIPAVEQVIVRRMDAVIQAAETRRDAHLTTINVLMEQPTPEEIHEGWQNGQLFWYELLQNMLRVVMLLVIVVAAVGWFMWLRRDAQAVSQRLIATEARLVQAQARTEDAREEMRRWVDWLRGEEAKQRAYERQAQ